MQITNKLNLPEAIVKAVSTERHNKSETELSATTLLKGVKEIILTWRHWDEMAEDAADRIWAVWGQAVHALLEHEGKTDFTECDLKSTMRESANTARDVTITGRIDNYDMETGTITDYKTASVYKVMAGDFEDWRMQGLIYAWLLTENEFRVDKCRFVTMLKDHSQSKAKHGKGYPQSPVYIYEFPVTNKNLGEAGEYICKRVNEYLKYKDVPDDEIPPCTDKERWASDTSYAVMKTGRKSAVRVLATKAESDIMAIELGTGHYVVTRPGESRKCGDYCSCCDFCNFYNSFVKNQAPSEG